MKLLHSLWDFFASVKLAIFTLCALALTSIIGTVIPQNETHSFYVSKFGAKIAHFFHILDIPTMYYSWWFLSLLGLLSANLIICSIDRFPGVLKIIKADNLSVKPAKLSSMSYSQQWALTPKQRTAIDIGAILTECGWKTAIQNSGNDQIFFSQKHPWSRTGVYIVHISILVIFTGAIIGHFFGFKGSVMLPELKTTKQIYSYKTSTPIDLGFSVRCNSFGIQFYDNGMPKEYKSSLTVLEGEKVILEKDIRVNSPLTYKGITFYQSSYQGYKDFIVRISNSTNGDTQEFVMPFQEQVRWENKNVQFGIINAEAIGQRVVRAKVWFKEGDSPATTQWIDDSQSTTIETGANTYTISAKQMYATGLQVAKDPGVWLVYLGCGLMLIGLYMAFFLSHKRIWVCIQSDSAKTTLQLAGSTNKNKQALSKAFNTIKSRIDSFVEK